MAAPADYAQQATVCQSKAVRVDIDAVPLFGDAPIEYAEQLGTVGGDVLLVAPSRNQGILAGAGRDVQVVRLWPAEGLVCSAQMGAWAGGRGRGRAGGYKATA